MEEQQNQDRTDFLKETIKQRPLNRKKLIRKTIITAAMAACVLRSGSLSDLSSSGTGHKQPPLSRRKAIYCGTRGRERVRRDPAGGYDRR